LAVFILRLLFFKLFTAVVPVKQKCNKSCDVIMGDHVERRLMICRCFHSRELHMIPVLN